jgi:hypothetical protein
MLERDHDGLLAEVRGLKSQLEEKTRDHDLWKAEAESSRRRINRMRGTS